MIIVHPADDHVVGTLLVVAAKHKQGAVILLGKELELGGVLKGSDVVLLVVGNRVGLLKDQSWTMCWTRSNKIPSLCRGPSCNPGQVD